MAKSNGECELCGQESSLRSFGDKNLCMKCGIIHITAGSNPQLLIQCLLDSGKMPTAESVVDDERVAVLKTLNQQQSEEIEKLKEDNSAYQEGISSLRNDLDEINAILGTENGVSTVYKLREVLTDLRNDLQQRTVALNTYDHQSKDTILLDIVLASMAGEDIQLGPDVIRQLR